MHPPTTEASNNNNNNNNTALPIHKLIHKSLTEILDVDLRKELSSNIILTGGASLFPTLDKRLSVELGEVLPSSYKYKVIGSKNTLENRYSAWIGGSILSSLGSFQQVSTTSSSSSSHITRIVVYLLSLYTFLNVLCTLFPTVRLSCG